MGGCGGGERANDSRCVCRTPAQRKDRATLRPEVSRTRTFGAAGTSEGQFFDQLARMTLCRGKVDWGGFDADRLVKVRVTRLSFSLSVCV